MNKLLNKILPFLNEYIPEELALKGINKVSPKIGSFLQKGLASGLPIAGGLAFLKDQLQGTKQQKIDRTLRPDEQAGLTRQAQSKAETQKLKGAAKLGIGLAGGLGAGLAGNALLDQMQPQQGAPEVQQPQQSQQAPDQRNIISQYSDELDSFLNKLIQQGRNPLEAGALAQLHPKFQKIISKMEQDHKAPFSSILSSIYGQGQQSQPQSQQPNTQNGNTDSALLAALDKILKM
jgi:hypothetical protein